jgi:hypothetical protein
MFEKRRNEPSFYCFSLTDSNFLKLYNNKYHYGDYSNHDH